MGPTRSCVVCKKKQNKNDLIRIISDENENAILDEKQKINSRGIYFCKNEICLNRFLNLIKKNKYKVKISIKNDSLIELISKVKDELGE